MQKFTQDQKPKYKSYNYKVIRANIGVNLNLCDVYRFIAAYISEKQFIFII